MPSPLYSNFVTVLRASESAKLVMPNALKSLEAAYADATDEQLQRAMDTIKGNNQQQFAMDAANLQAQGGLAEKAKQQLKLVKKSHLKQEEKIDRRDSDEAAWALIDKLEEV